MHLKIRWTKVIDAPHWKQIVITHLWQYDDNGDYIKFIAMDEWIAEFLKTFPIIVNWPTIDLFQESLEEVNTLLRERKTQCSEGRRRWDVSDYPCCSMYLLIVSGQAFQIL